MTFLLHDLFEHKNSKLYIQVIHLPHQPLHGLLSFMNAEPPVTTTISPVYVFIVQVEAVWPIIRKEYHQIKPYLTLLLPKKEFHLVRAAKKN